jgi:hypothetical protein
MVKRRRKRTPRPHLIEALAHMHVNDLHITSDVTTTPELHSALQHQEAKLGAAVFKSFAYRGKVYVVRVK